MRRDRFAGVDFSPPPDNNVRWQAEPVPRRTRRWWFLFGIFCGVWLAIMVVAGARLAGWPT